MKLAKLIDRLRIKIPTPTTLVRELKERGYDAVIVKSANSIPSICTPTIFIIAANNQIIDIVMS